MKVDKSVCTTELPLGAAVLDPAVPPPPLSSSTSQQQPAACFSTADRYGVVFTTLLENKMLAIRQQATTVVDKRKPPRGDASSKGVKAKRRGLAKTLSLCVRRNSLPSAGGERHASRPPEDTTVVDIELGHIKGGTVTDDDGAMPADGCCTDIDDDTELPPDVSFDVPAEDPRHEITTMSASNDETWNKDCQQSSPPSSAPQPPPPTTSLSDPLSSIHSGDSSAPLPSSACVQNNVRSDGDVSSGHSAVGRVSITHSLPAIIAPEGERQQHTSLNAVLLSPTPPPIANRARTLSNARRHHQRVLEARSISAQASPVLPRTHSGSGGGVCLVSGRPQTVSSSTSHPFASVCTITENLIAEPRPPVAATSAADATATHRFAETLAQSLVAVNTRERAVTTRSTVDSDTSSHGFINNFNELTAHSLSSVVCVNRPVITTTATSAAVASEQRQQRYRAGWPSRPSSFDHRSADRWSPEGGEYNAGRSSYRNQRHARRSRMLMDGEESDRSEEKRNRRKYRHRGSDPVLIYPSSTGLPQCLLSMPPNRSIQIKYDDNTLYDVSLELDRKQAKKDVAARKSGHGRHHHHHHHHRHHHGNSHRHHMDDPDASTRRHARRHRKRILVHDLDTQKVKVIDPDDLPQRARWTIIATACLLLIMCLLLVGVTLRMAPLIDDMVRQENERLQQESLNRSRFVRNLTDTAAAMSSADPYPLAP